MRQISTDPRQKKEGEEEKGTTEEARKEETDQAPDRRRERAGEREREKGKGEWRKRRRRDDCRKRETTGKRTAIGQLRQVATRALVCRPAAALARCSLIDGLIIICACLCFFDSIYPCLSPSLFPLSISHSRTALRSRRSA